MSNTRSSTWLSLADRMIPSDNNPEDTSLLSSDCKLYIALELENRESSSNGCHVCHHALPFSLVFTQRMKGEENRESERVRRKGGKEGRQAKNLCGSFEP